MVIVLLIQKQELKSRAEATTAFSWACQAAPLWSLGRCVGRCVPLQIKHPVSALRLHLIFSDLVKISSSV